MLQKIISSVIPHSLYKAYIMNNYFTSIFLKNYQRALSVREFAKRWVNRYKRIKYSYYLQEVYSFVGRDIGGDGNNYNSR